MSGTSMDGVDAAFVVTDGRTRVEAGPAITAPYPEALRARIRSVLGGKGPVAEVEREVTLAHVECVRRLRARHELGEIDLIGFHGQTILHRPEEGRTWQIGDGALLAERTRIDVVCDFRTADVQAGGEGAPLAPVYHQALAAGLERPLAVLNIGGVANVTWIGPGDDQLLAFDTGPGNALIDDWLLAHTGRPIDKHGALAGTGQADERFLGRVLAHPFFARTPPKSLDRDDFAAFRPIGLSPADGAATLTALTAATVAAALRHMPAPPKRWLITGGGRRNPVLMGALRSRLDVPVDPVEAAGWDGDALEAQAFAYMAVRSVEALPLSFPTTTGAPHPLTGGRVFPSGRR
jgi:anhydro-N-acetylmuramic acid kinase